jgi:amino acid transporter/nucleotide-binding universal stress UspA family protein
MKHKQDRNITTELSRDLGLTSALAIGIGTMIAAGIFTLSGLAVRNVGSAAIASFMLAALVATFTALTYCEFVSIYPRTGEGYLYARKTFTPPLAYFVGWALFLGYASSCAFYIASLSSYFNEFIWHSPLESLSGILILVALTLLNIKGTKESGKFQIVVTAAKIVLLIWFIAGGIQFIEPMEVINRFSTDIVQIGSTAAMVFITFFGFSAIAASAGEVKNPVKNIPKAIFLSMTVVTVLYTAVVLVLLFAGLNEYTEAAMGEAAKKFLGGIGGYVIIGGAIFSMISASNASIMAGARVILSMSHMRHLPQEIGIINSRTKTPIVATILVGGSIIIFAMLFPLEDLSYFANTVLLIALILVNAALIIHRKKYPDIKRPFKVPLVPLLPIIGILANIYLIIQIFQHPIPLLIAIGCLILGMVGFVAWKGSQTEETSIPGFDSFIAHSHGRGMSDNSRFRVLVPLSNPDTMEQLISIAAPIAKGKDGEILLLKVVTVPRQMSPTSYQESAIEKEEVLLKRARKMVESYGVPSHAVIRVGYDVARAILETSRKHNCKLTVMGWKGHSTNREKIMGTITDAVVSFIRTDIMLAKFVQDGQINNILLPTAGGEHAQCAEQYASTLVQQNNGSLTVCQIVSPAAEEDEIKERRDFLAGAIRRIRKSKKGLKVQSKILVSASVHEGIIDGAKDYDAIMVGAAGKSMYHGIMFGNIPEEIAKNINKTVIIVKHYHPVKALMGRVVAD